MKRKIISCMISLLMMISITNINTFANSDIAVKINGETVNFQQPPIMKDNRILVPIRALAETMKFDVDWNGDEQLVTISDMSKTIKLKLGEDSISKSYKYRYMYNGDDIIKIDVPAAVYNDYTYVPLRSVTEIFGADVSWEQNTQTAEITYLNTYGKIINFEDSGMEKLCRLEVLLDYYNDADTNKYQLGLQGLTTTEFLRNEGDEAKKDYDYLIANNTPEEGEKWSNKWLDIREQYWESIFEDGNIPLYEGPIYEGMVMQIKYLGLYDGYFSDANIDSGYVIPSWLDIKSLDDMKYLSNVTEVALSGCETLSDISGLKYNDKYKSILVSGCPIYNFDVLNDITVEEYVQIGYSDADGYPHYIGDWDDSTYTYEFNQNKYQAFVKTAIELNNKINEVCRECISDNMSDYEKAKAAHDWLVDNVEYDLREENSDEIYPELHDFSGAFLEGKAVCQGYGEAYKLLCDMAGLDCMYVSGEANGGSHGWNIVKVDGEYYHVDVTFDDTSGNTYEYFLKSDSFMKQDHTWRTDLIGLHECPKSYGE